VDPGEAPTGAEPLITRTKYEDWNIYPQPRNPGNRVFFNYKL